MKWVTKGINVIKTLGYNVLIPAPHDEELNKLDADTEYTVSITKRSKRRSLNANAYAWVLCEKIARELSKNAYISKNDVYKRVIQEAGTFTYLPIKNDAIDRFIEIWQGHGLGWHAEDAGPAKTEGYTIVRAYHGSSVYTVDEMRRLIDALIDECNQLNIPIENNDYINSLIQEWGNEQKEEAR
jgi:hypothetical protein